MVDDRPQLGDPQRLALKIAFDVFRERGEWPSYQHIDRQLHRQGIPSADVLASLPLELTQFDRYHPQQTAIALTVAGLAAIEAAQAELDLFLRTVRWLVRREAEYEPPSPTESGRITVTSAEFLHDEGLELSRLELAKILELLRVEWLTAGSGGPSEGDPIWQVTVDEKIRPYDGVASVGEYLGVKRRLLEEAGQQVPTQRPSDLAVSTPDEGRTEPASGPADPSKVFVIYGRNEAARVAMFELLRALGLHPLEWRELRAATGKPSPYIGEVLDAGFAMSQACVVLMTPDEAVRLREEFIEDPLEQLVAHQPRPNVLLEMGMALDKYRDRTC